MSELPTLYVLDGSYYVFRAFHAIQHLSNSQGMPTNGLFAFTNMLLNVIRDERPRYLAVAFDPKGETFRNEIYSEYKANREAPPEELVVQMPYFREIVKALRIPVLEVPGLEADDMIGSLAASPLRAGMEMTILSGDKDLCQLLDESTTMVDSMRGKRMGVAEVRERFGVGPEGVADVLALAGDTSDNIPGVPGIGEKTAGKLIAEFGSIDNLLANIDRVSGAKRKENLRANVEQIRLARRLTEIRTDVELGVDLDDLELCPPDFEAFERLCQVFEFNRFPAMLRGLFPDASRERALAATEELDYRTVWTLDELDAVLDEARRAGRLAFDLETTSLDPLDAEIVGVALCSAPLQAWYVPVGHRVLSERRQLSLDAVLERLRPVLEDASIELVLQNACYELRVMERYGVQLANVGMDTMLAAYLLDPNRRRYNLDALALEHLDHTTIAFGDVAGTGKDQVTFDLVGIEEATRYAAEDADVTLRLADAFAPGLGEGRLRAVLTDVEIPLARVIARMEQTGVRVDTGFLGELSREFRGRLAGIERAIYEAAGTTFSIQSPVQLREILFEQLKLRVIKRTKSGPSTDQSVLEELRGDHPLPGLILDYRHLAKLASTYVESLPGLVHPRTGRVHTSYHQAVAATGRLSSSNPNLQNIPVRSEDGRRIRQAFVPEDGWLLLGGDYSQIELRILAHMSADPVLVRAFEAGEDIHRRTAAEVFGVEPIEVTSEQRSAAKAINFGLIYGMGANRLADELGITRGQAREYIERYFERLARVKPFFDGLISSARERGYAETVIGRRRPIPELRSSRPADVAQGERLAMNTPIQGSAASGAQHFRGHRGRFRRTEAAGRR